MTFLLRRTKTRPIIMCKCGGSHSQICPHRQLNDILIYLYIWNIYIYKYIEKYISFAFDIVYCLFVIWSKGGVVMCIFSLNYSWTYCGERSDWSGECVLIMIGRLCVLFDFSCTNGSMISCLHPSALLYFVVLLLLFCSPAGEMFANGTNRRYLLYRIDLLFICLVQYHCYFRLDSTSHNHRWWLCWFFSSFIADLLYSFINQTFTWMFVLICCHPTV